MTTPSIDLITQQIASLQAQLNQAKNPSPIIPPIQPVTSINHPGNTAEDLRLLVRGILTEELTKLKEESLVKPNAAPQQLSSDKTSKILTAIGAVLTEEEQKWFSDFKNLGGLVDYLPTFLSSDDGKLLIRTLADAYRSHKCT